MKILVVDVGRFGDEPTLLTSYKSEGTGGSERLSRQMTLGAQAKHVAAEASKYDYVCVDEAGIGAAFVDELKHMGITNLLINHGMRPL